MHGFVVAPSMCVRVPPPTSRKSTNKRTSDGDASSKRTPRPVSSLSVGELLIGVVASVGGAESAWLDVNIATKRNKPVHARLRLRNGAPQPTVGAAMPVVVSRVNTPAARVEVIRPPSSISHPPLEPRKIEDVRTGEPLRGVVLALVKAGAVVDFGATRNARGNRREKCTALLRRRHFADRWASPADIVRRDDTERVLVVGDILDLYVHSAYPASGFLYVCVNPITEVQLATERASAASAMQKRARRRSIDSLKADETRHGSVRAVAKYGVFVDIGIKTDGLLHYSNMGDLRRSWRDVLVKGTPVDVRVIAIDGDRISLELLNVQGNHSGDELSVNPAIERPPPMSKRREKLQELIVTEPGDLQPDRSQVVSGGNARSDDVKQPDEEEGKEQKSASFDDKFTDEYFEDKYDY